MKRVLKTILFLTILFGLISNLNNILEPKNSNRYYMLNKELEHIEDIEIQIYGSCHAYTSFDAPLFTEEYGLSSYDLANPCEILPTTYLRMFERFKTDIPKVALVEIWGVNAYDTYFEPKYTLGSYFRTSIETIPMSREKNEVINDFDTLDILNENLPIAKYKVRLLDNSISEIDFNYTFEKAYQMYGNENKLYDEMKARFNNDGFLPNESKELLDYKEKQSKVKAYEKKEIEPDIMKYVDKIIQLCEENNVELIFYRAPYISKDIELKKANYMEEYLNKKDVVFVDLEKELEYDYNNDFFDYEHLSRKGAQKSTQYLGTIVIDLLNKK